LGGNVLLDKDMPEDVKSVADNIDADMQHHFDIIDRAMAKVRNGSIEVG
jgi:hypothetical protein